MQARQSWQPISSSPRDVELRCTNRINAANRYWLATWRNADQALEQRAEGTHIDAVISDYRMPGMNGIELANSLQGQYPLMLISADNLQDVVGKIPVITKYKRKPLAPEEFLDEVKMLFACADPV